MNKFLDIVRVGGRIDLVRLIISLAITLGAGILSAYFTKDAFEVYRELNRPGFAPPGQVFGPVWTFLYFIIGTAAYRVWMHIEERPGLVGGALLFYMIQLLFNFLWSIIFFGLGMRGLALIEIVALLVLIIVTTARFHRVDRLAAGLMLPYIAWVAFATILNYYVWVLN